MASKNVAPEDYAREFNHTAHLQGKALILIMVPMFALGAWALYHRRRRFFGEHLVFSFYTYAFFMLWMTVGTMILSPLIVAATQHGWSDGMVETAANLAITLPIGIYLVFAVRGSYGGDWVSSVIKAVLLTGWMAVCLTAYRFVWFFTSLSAT